MLPVVVQQVGNGTTAPVILYVCFVQVVTAPYDPRFPNRNQARHCFVRFNEYLK